MKDLIRLLKKNNVQIKIPSLTNFFILFADLNHDNVNTKIIKNLDNTVENWDYQKLNEINRILKPGGKLAILEFCRPKNSIFQTLFSFYFNKIIL